MYKAQSVDTYIILYSKNEAVYVLEDSRGTQRSRIGASTYTLHYRGAFTAGGARRSRVVGAVWMDRRENAEYRSSRWCDGSLAMKHVVSTFHRRIWILCMNKGWSAFFKTQSPLLFCILYTLYFIYIYIYIVFGYISVKLLSFDDEAFVIFRLTLYLISLSFFLSM